MQDYDKILTITDGENVKLADSFSDYLGTRLVMGQTRYVCRYGTLSDGHEKITSAQRYYQAIKEMWVLRSSMKRMQADAMLAQADLLDAKEQLHKAATEIERLRANGKIIHAKESLISTLTTVRDQERMIDEYNKIRMELATEVEARYPAGIEQAEADNWRAVAEYRMLKQNVPGSMPERLDNIPMSPEDKARFGLETGRADAVAPLMISNQAKFLEITNEVNPALLGLLPNKETELKLVENK